VAIRFPSGLLGEAWQPGPEASRYVAGYPDACRRQVTRRRVASGIGYLIREDGSTANFTEPQVLS
jgi:hypothetical protein